MLVTGFCLSMIGYIEGVDIVQPKEVTMRLLTVAFMVGPLISLIALVVIKLYPVNEGVLQKIRSNGQ